MPLALVALAWILVMTGIRGDYTAVGAAFQQDVIGTGKSGFLSWMIGIVGIAVFFRLIGLPGAGKVFMILVIVVFLLQNNAAVLANLESIGGGASSPTASTSSAGTASTSGETSGTGSST